MINTNRNILEFTLGFTLLYIFFVIAKCEMFILEIQKG